MKIKLVALSLFISGAGTKLFQSQLGNSTQIMTLPSYPLLYFYPHWKDWKKKYKKISVSKAYSLIIKHHRSVIDSRKIPGFNGLNNLGKKKDKSIKVSEKKFKKYFFEYLKEKKVDSKNVLIAIHYAFHKSRKENFKKIKYILFHVHNFEYYKKFLLSDFPDSKLILITRNPLENFWRRAYTNNEIEKNRYDYSDREYLKNSRYLNLLNQIFLDVDNMDKYLVKNKNVKIIKFEDLKGKNSLTISKIYKFLKINFYRKHLIPKFLGLEWWSHKNYKGFNKNKIFEPKLNLDPNDDRKFYFYEKFVLEALFFQFYKKFGYYTNISRINFILFFFLIFLPTKHGVKLFFERLSIKNFLFFIKHSYKECFNYKLKNYYFNAMYKYKYLYRNKYFINKNILRKCVYNLKDSKLKKIMCLILFVFKILSYPYFQIELLILYFLRIYKLLKYFIFINVIKISIIKKLKLS